MEKNVNGTMQELPNMTTEYIQERVNTAVTGKEGDGSKVTAFVAFAVHETPDGEEYLSTASGGFFSPQLWAAISERAMQSAEEMERGC